MAMTLDNSSILNQQLEALEYHKRKLEKEGALLSQDAGSASNRMLQRMLISEKLREVNRPHDST